MKKNNIAFTLFLAAVMVFTSCQPDEHELSPVLDKSEIQYEITQDLVTDPGGNTVIMKNSTPGTITYWDYGSGHSTNATETIHFAFKGEYVIKLSVLTAGGMVNLDPKTITVTENNLEYVNDPLWTALSGGVGNEKTWILDINATKFDGPMYFYGTNNGWLEGGDKGCYGKDCWNWSPVYKDNTWLMPGGDYGTMTFSLKDKAGVVVNHLMIPSRGTETGSYFLDATAKKLTLTGATPIHDAGRDACVDAWGSITLFSLTETTMQLGVLRKTSCDGAAMLVYNYVVKP
jgi:hypothetical protein